MYFATRCLLIACSYITSVSLERHDIQHVFTELSRALQSIKTQTFFTSYYFTCFSSTVTTLHVFYQKLIAAILVKMLHYYISIH